MPAGSGSARGVLGWTGAVQAVGLVVDDQRRCALVLDQEVDRAAQDRAGNLEQERHLGADAFAAAGPARRRSSSRARPRTEAQHRRPPSSPDRRRPAAEAVAAQRAPGLAACQSLAWLHSQQRCTARPLPRPPPPFGAASSDAFGPGRRSAIEPAPCRSDRPLLVGGDRGVGERSACGHRRPARSQRRRAPGRRRGLGSASAAHRRSARPRAVEGRRG